MQGRGTDHRVDHVPDRTRFGYLGRPTGWFQIGWSAEFERGDVRPLRYFDRDLVGYRDATGDLHVLSAHCQHLGAHLGYGGWVEDENIVCPFHGWRWSPEGKNVEIPYSSQPPKKNRVLDSLQVTERSGLVYLWHDRRGREPFYDPPSIPETNDDDWFQFWPEGINVVHEARVFPQMIIENAVDLVHVKYVHGWEDIPLEEDVEQGDAWFRSTFSGNLKTAKGEQPIRNVSEIWGVGCIISRLTGLRDTIQVMCTTPVENDVADVRFSVLVRRDPDDPPNGRPGLVQGIIRAQTETEWAKDAPIWRHMTYIDRAPFAREEARAFVALRRWSDRFYPERDPE